MTFRTSISGAEEEESFFVSMTDIMVGLLFVFILLVMYFAIQVQLDQKRISALEIEVDKSGGILRRQLDKYRENVTRQKIDILDGLKGFLEREGFPSVEIDYSQGIFRLPEGVLFNSGQFEITESSSAHRASNALATGLAQVLPCSVMTKEGGPFRERTECENSTYDNPHSAFIEAIYVEGHTDSRDIRKGGLVGDVNITTNLKLSARRATNTFESIVSYKPEILSFYGPNSQLDSLITEPVLAVSSYGPYRPIADNSKPKGRAYNRRIDLRIVMYQPVNTDSLVNLLEKLGLSAKDINL